MDKVAIKDGAGRVTGYRVPVLDARGEVVGYNEERAPLTVEPLRKAVAPAPPSNNDKLLAAVERLTRTMERPVKPILDANGKIIGIKREPLPAEEKKMTIKEFGEYIATRIKESIARKTDPLEARIAELEKMVIELKALMDAMRK